MSGANDPYDPKEVAALSAEHLDAAVQKAREAFAGAADLEALASVKPGHLGDRSPVLLARREIGALPPKAKAEAGKRVNEAQSAIKTAFDERFARFSPGVLLQRENLAILERPDIAWTDSCAAADHPMIDHIWRERRAIARLSIAIGGPLRRMLFACLVAAELRRRPAGIEA